MKRYFSFDFSTVLRYIGSYDEYSDLLNSKADDDITLFLKDPQTYDMEKQVILDCS